MIALTTSTHALEAGRGAPRRLDREERGRLLNAFAKAR
jgi:hypothetical protein